MINKIWNVLIVVGILISIFTGEITNMGNIILGTANDAFSIFFNTSLLLLFWGGLFNIAIESGLVKNLTKAFQKPLSKLFPELPKDHPAMEYICSNIIANMLGLGSAATPLGLKAFEEMQKLNNKDTPSRSMITFIVINVSSLTIFPTTIISMRMMYGGETSLPIVILMILMTVVSTIIAITIDRILYNIDKRRNR